MSTQAELDESIAQCIADVKHLESQFPEKQYAVLLGADDLHPMARVQIWHRDAAQAAMMNGLEMVYETS